MLKKLKQRRLRTRLIELVKSGDLQLWPKVRDEITTADLCTSFENEGSALELCIGQGHAKLLGEILHRFPELNQSELRNGESMVATILKSKHALLLLSAMLSNGLGPNTTINGQTLIEMALEQPPQQAMLLINRLAQHGASLDNPKLVIHAIRSGHQPLVKFLADSGAPLVVEDVEGLDPQLVDFAKRAIDDKKIRDMWA